MWHENYDEMLKILTSMFRLVNNNNNNNNNINMMLLNTKEWASSKPIHPPLHQHRDFVVFKIIKVKVHVCLWI